MEGLTTAAVAVITAIIGVAVVAVLVGQNSQTSSVLSSAGTAFSGVLGTAMGGGSSSMGGFGFGNNPWNFMPAQG